MQISDGSQLTIDENNRRFKLINYKVWETKIGEIWQKYEDAGCQPIIIKGWAAAQYYPEPENREFVDLDLMVVPQNFAQANEVLKNAGFAFPIDLHAGPRHLDNLSFHELYDNSIEIACGGKSNYVRVLKPEDHLRILSVHWLTDGGANREKLFDIYYGIKNRSADFDWSRFLETATDRRRRWIECVIGIAHKYLDLPIENTPVAKSALNLPSWLVQTLEKEWADETKLQPLNINWKKRKEMWQQLRKRFPPNAIQATVLQEGSFDRYPRIGYQIANIFNRSWDSISKINKY